MPRSRPSSIVVRPDDASLPEALRELCDARGLLRVLVGRHLSVRYSQTLFGVAWVLVQPLLTAALFTVVFSVFARIPTAGMPYPLFVLSGMVLWLVFAHGLERSSQSLVQDERLITKVYFPRLLLPLAGTLSVLVDFGVSLLVLLPLAWWFGFPPGIGLFWIPAAVLPVMMLSGGCGALLASLNIRWRDLRHATPFFVQALIWGTPVAWPMEVVPATWRPWMYLNPLAAPVQVFRHAVADAPLPPVWSASCSLVLSAIVLLAGILVFRRFEKTFADYI